MRVSRYNSNRRAVNAIRTYGPKIVQGFKKVYNGFSKSNKRSAVKDNVSNSRGITTQHDSRTVYVRKPMPKGKRSQWKKFKSKVSAVEISNRGKTNVVLNGFNDYNIPTTVVIDGVTYSSQGFGECHLYGFNGSAVEAHSGTKDIQNILQDRNTNATTIGVTGIETRDLGSDNSFQRKAPLLFSSAYIDVTWTVSGASGVEFDLYTIVYNTPIRGQSDSITNSALASTTDNQAVYVGSSPSVAAAARIDIRMRGVTLFDVAKGFSRCGGTIIKKEKFFIAPGNSITKSIRDAKNRTISSPVEDTGAIVFATKGRTQSFFWIAKALNGASTTVRQSATRGYKYTQEGISSSQSRYINT